MPVCAASTQWRPISTLCAIWTRLSILVPSPITVSRIAPRSIVVLAPISTSSWMMTRPTCGTLPWPPAARQIAEAVLPDARAGMDDDAVADQRVDDGRARADGAIAADPHVRADHGVGADHACRRRSRRAGRSPPPGSITTPSSSRAVGCTSAPGDTPLASNSEDGRSAPGKSALRDRDEGAIGRGRRPARRRAAARPRRSAPS